ncbi:40-residue YVTN family beta-propeller repeat-containing protein [Cnuella takakiae]|uniref:40-residue YVTN family beta-propeller repeat-containing protein n=2 Tax=Cnuella takakiae TaxID=1302690 RepID=A0A1M4T0D0_9BACT|nr:40-residue YVTN family beta-propeller repeat-containing protein [Cnuella takakiae]
MLGCLSALVLSAGAQSLPQPVQLPNGWKLSPAGASLPLGDLPLNMAVSRSGKYIAVSNNGQGVQSIQLLDARAGRLLDTITIPKSWYGLQFTGNEQNLYASGGNDNRILKYRIAGGQLVLSDSISLGKPWPNKIGPAGLQLDESRGLLYVVTKEDNSLYIVDLKTGQVLRKLGLEAEAYTCLLGQGGKKLYISCWGCDKVLTFDTQKQVFEPAIAVGDNPNELLLAPNGKHLYVCNANDNTVSVIDVRQGLVVETLDAALYAQSPSGSTTNGLALDAAGKTLYAANADNNCLAVFDVSKPGTSRPRGFIPTGWYPTNVKVVNNRIWVTNGKGLQSKANPFGPNPLRKREEVIHHAGTTKPAKDLQYIAALFQGTMSIIKPPTEAELQAYTKAAYRNAAYTKEKEAKAEGPAGNNPIPVQAGTKSPIKYVFYVVKENRTYDQVLADMPGGNGDTSLLLFGKNITPNQHRLASEFVLLDNFYVDAEVSADGHNWSMGGYATDYLEKTWPTSYGGRGGTYGGEGERTVANNKGGFIWDQCRRYGVSFRTYGEFADEGKANIPVLQNNFCPYYPGYNMNIKDTFRYRQWEREFDSLLAKGKVPQFNTVRFGNDHTEGLRLNRPTPYAHVADNDLAVGMFIEHLAKSPIWNETAVFILEDDAQNGADHVDAHRSPAYLAGGFVKRGFIDHTPYTTTSVLRTMELILGLPPMTQYDAAAVPLWRCFDTVAKASAFRAEIPSVSLDEQNLAQNEWQRRSESFNFAKEDANNDLEFNWVLWHGIKGNTPFPGPRRSAFVLLVEEEEEDD